MGGDSANDGHNDDFDVYDIEYEPEGASSDEDEAGGGRNKDNHDSSDDDESDLDIPEIVVATAMEILDNCRTDDDADQSSDNEDYDPTRADMENADTWTCLDCNQPNTPYIRYCSACYKVALLVTIEPNR